MKDVFLLIINNVEITSIILVAIMLIRLIFKKIPKMIYPILWGVAGIKLLIPFDIYSSVGVLSNEKTIESVSGGNAPIIVRTGMTSVDKGVNHYIGSVYQGTNISTNHGFELMDILAMIWVAGMVCMVGYLLISYYLMRRKVSQSIIIESGVSICDEISSPFLMGIIKPHIYIPSGLDKTKYEYVLAHERMHKKRGDALWKIVAFVLLSIYWFNPLCWISYLLFCKDVELACDESVIKSRELTWRSDYCQALLECNNGSRKVAFIPVAFGEVGVKQRVKNVLQYKKTKPIIVAVILVLCVGIFVCLGTKHMVKPVHNKDEKQVNSTVTTKKATLKENEFYGEIPTIDLSLTAGADGARLYYADEEKIIFGGSFGLFVYNTKNHSFIQSVDLETIGYSMTQGDEACEIRANKDGSLVYLQKMNDKEHMLIYHVTDNRFEEVAGNYKKDSLFDGFLYLADDDYVSDTQVTFKDHNGKKRECWLVNAALSLGEVGYKYLDDELVYPLFTWERFQGAEYFKPEDVKNIVKVEMNFHGKHYVCTEEKILQQLENGFSKGKKSDGGSGCPFDDVMYLTREDGVVGMVLPATDSCKACYLADGYYELDDSLAMSVRDMIEKGMPYVEETVDMLDTASMKKRILTGIKRTMPDIVYQELLKKGICKQLVVADDGEEEGTISYSIGNDKDNPTLRLDFAYSLEGVLLQYVNKEYGFTDNMIEKKTATFTNAKENIITFQNTIDNWNANEKRNIKKVKAPARFDDIPRYECYRDDIGTLYVYDGICGMLVFMEKQSFK